ncbi:hypothetical protein [Alteromonas ponticola]|uniref:Uncharacterized protein n=1 Tax=Alteromonas ponticola TaxID=2720613 RepID=A0ABX1R051_9ALTE|nr:hypothetical protein [Alteromonas ponticola]NMH59123.1 hypothetical protein [Alteromonas ponticola]
MYKKTTLEQVVAYQNTDIVERFIKIYGVETEEAVKIFNSTKMWMWLSYQRRRLGVKRHLVIDSPLVVIDEMWHNFILFTHAYTHFCEQFFGFYMHHAPTTNQMIEESKKQNTGLSADQIKQKMMDDKRWQYEFVYDQLGKEEFLLWYKQYPKQYSPESLAKLALENEQRKLAELHAKVEERKAQLAGAA